MEVVLRGWQRNHGRKPFASGELTAASEGEDDGRLWLGKTYARTVWSRHPTRRPLPKAVEILMSARDLNLNGNYLMECTLTKSDIVRLFQMTHPNDLGNEAVAQREDIESEISSRTSTLRNLVDIFRTRWRSQRSKNVELLSENAELKRKLTDVEQRLRELAGSLTEFRARPSDVAA
jgi:hypothetical protein